MPAGTPSPRAGTIVEGWRSLGIWTTWYFGVYVVLWGAAVAGTGLPLPSPFPFLGVTW